jgi:flagellar biosynthesis component FlhA
MKEKALFFIGVWMIVLAYLIGLPTEIKNILFTITGLIVIAIGYGSHFHKIKLRKKHEEPVKEVREVEEKPNLVDVKPKYEQAYEVRKSKKRILDMSPEEEVENEVVVISSDDNS